MSNSEIRALSRRNLEGNWMKFALVTLVIGLVTWTPEFMLNTVSGSMIFDIVTFIVALVIGVFSIGLYLNLVRKGTFDLSKGISESKVYLRFAGFSLIIGVLVFVVIFVVMAIFISILGGIAIGSMMYEGSTDILAANLIIMVIGIALILILIALIINTFFLPVEYLLIDGVTLVESLSKSLKLMKGNKWRFFKLQLSFAGWFLLGVITLGIGLLWVVPYFNTSIANFYLIVKGEKVSDEIIENII